MSWFCWAVVFMEVTKSVSHKSHGTLLKSQHTNRNTRTHTHTYTLKKLKTARKRGFSTQRSSFWIQLMRGLFWTWKSSWKYRANYDSWVWGRSWSHRPFPTGLDQSKTCWLTFTWRKLPVDSGSKCFRKSVSISVKCCVSVCANRNREQRIWWTSLPGPVYLFHPTIIFYVGGVHHPASNPNDMYLEIDLLIGYRRRPFDGWVHFKSINLLSS